MQLNLGLLRRGRTARTAIAVLVAAVVLSGFWAALAFAANRSYNGPAGSGPHAGVEFGAHFRKGRAVGVYRFEYHNIPAQCQGSGTTATSDKLDITMKVKAKRKFGGHETLNGGKVTVKVTGRFAKGYSSATGTLRVHGTVPGCPAADTGVVSWTAPAITP
jgi:hypothetical protein